MANSFPSVRQVRSLSIDSSGHIARAVSIAMASFAVGGGALTLAGWAFNIQRLTDWNNEGVSMFANTAIGVIMIGGALLLLPRGKNEPARRWSAHATAIVAALIGGLTIFEHLTGNNLGIDTMLINRPWGQRASAAPMRMGLPASTSLLVLGSAILLSMRGAGARKLASMLALSVMAIVSLSLIGYWYSADQLYLVPRFTGIAWQTSIILAALGIGVIATVPEFGPVAILSRDDTGGVLARRLILPIIGIPLLLGWFRLIGQNAGLYDVAFGTAVRTVIEIILLAALLWWTADGISRQAMLARSAESALRESEQRFRLMADAAPVFIWVSSADKLCTWFNKQWLKFVGRPMEKEVGHG
jgi:PAS domain-containing protein